MSSTTGLLITAASFSCFSILSARNDTKEHKSCFFYWGFRISRSNRLLCRVIWGGKKINKWNTCFLAPGTTVCCWLKEAIPDPAAVIIISPCFVFNPTHFHTKKSGNTKVCTAAQERMTDSMLSWRLGSCLLENHLARWSREVLRLIPQAVAEISRY